MYCTDFFNPRIKSTIKPLSAKMRILRSKKRPIQPVKTLEFTPIYKKSSRLDHTVQSIEEVPPLQVQKMPTIELYVKMPPQVKPAPKYDENVQVNSYEPDVRFITREKEVFRDRIIEKVKHVPQSNQSCQVSLAPSVQYTVPEIKEVQNESMTSESSEQSSWYGDSSSMLLGMRPTDYEGYHYIPGVANTKTYRKPIIKINDWIKFEKRPVRSKVKEVKAH